MSNLFLDELKAAVENQQPTEEIMKDAYGAGDPDLNSEKEANATDGNPGSPGDDGNPVAQPDPDRDPKDADLASMKTADDPSGNPDSPGDVKSNPAPASESDVTGPSEGNFHNFGSEVNTIKGKVETQLPQQKEANDPTGNTGDPNKEKQTPVGPGSNSSPAALDKGVRDSYDESGNAGEPGDNGTPVSKSGDSKPLPKSADEKAADDADGNPGSPGANADPAPSFESFIAACEQFMTDDTRSSIRIPASMSLESYALQLGLGEIAKMAVEASLTAAEKAALKDSDFGLPEERGWPLHDESHVRSAIQNFHWCPKDKQRTLAKNILKAIRRFDMKDIEVSEGNPFYAYYPEAKLVPRKKPQKKQG